MKKVEKLKALGAKLTGGTVTGNTVGDVLASIMSLADSGALKGLKSITGYDATKTQALKQTSGSFSWYDGMTADLASITGYDATKTQTLQNVNGTLTWVDVVTPGDG